ncbi:MAG: NAD(P)/FAD-dependent oxidoreductase [Candidatus Omnitrophica bacterium]|nr:NAD(P)/FAD-dependent oxidoreductase [Candidatus Omnitrophota bacterium]
MTHEVRGFGGVYECRNPVDRTIKPFPLYDIAVIGAGGAGQMALLRAVLNHLKTIVFLGDPKTSRRSRQTWVSEVENIPGMFDLRNPITASTRGVLQFIEKRSDLKPFLAAVKKAAVAIKKEGNVFTISASDETVQARFVVLCTGTMDVQPEINGSIEPIFPFANRGDVLYCIRCDGHRTAGKNCAVIGHTSTAGWIAVMLKERYDLPKLWVLANGKKFEGSSEVKTLLGRYQIQILRGKIEAVLGDRTKGLEGFQVAGEKIPVERGFVALGSIVYNELAKQLGAALDDRDHLVTNEYGETSVSGFYAAGDLVSGKKKQVYTAWDLAVDAVDDIDEKIRISKRKS